MLPLQSFAAWVNQFAAAVQGASSSLVDFTPGSILRAVAQANASVALWFQWLLLRVLSLTRAATSVGADLDAWMADFGFFRLGATYATGLVTFSRFTPAIQALILPGAQVQTGDGTQQFVVTANTANAAWSATLGGYVVPIGTASVAVPVQAVNLGGQGNVLSGAISQLNTAVSGIDTVTNAAQFSNGLDAEGDAAFRSRFQLWITSRSRGTVAAIQSAVLAVQQNFTVTVTVDVDTTNAFKAGALVVTVDDGSGSPSSAEVSAAANAVATVIGASIVYAVQAPTKLTANVAMDIVTQNYVSHSTIAANVTTALTNYISALPLGAPLPWSRLAQVAYDTDPSIYNVFNVLLNGATADIVPTAFGVIRPGTISVS